MHFECPVYHPQVKFSGADAGHMCADFVSADWKPSETIRGVLLKVRALLASPTADSALETEAAALLTKDLAEFEKIARQNVEKYCM